MPCVLSAAPAPVLYLEVARARARFVQLGEWVAPIRLRYAVKANLHPALLAALAAAGAPFAIMSQAELEALLALGVPGAQIACATPGPPASLLRRCRAAGVARYTVDSVWELRKTAALVPGAAVCVRLFNVPRGRVAYPAARLGLPIEHLAEFLAAARGLPVDLCGVAVHVGSQCERLAPWEAAVAAAGRAWATLRAAGLAPRVLDLGGGLPVAYRAPVPEPPAIARTLQRALAHHFSEPPAEVWLEPGRYIAAGAGVLAATVLTRAERPGGAPRLGLNVGRYHGLPEVALGLRYRYHAPGDGPTERVVLHGPLGPAADLIDRHAVLPRLAPGDRLFLLDAGAYTVCQAAYPTAPTSARVEVLPPDTRLEDVLAG